jgi:MoxR-like ATPase
VTPPLLIDEAPPASASQSTDQPPSTPAAGQLEEVLFELRRLIVGQDRLLECLLVALLSRGHVLLEGVPGLAKTATIKALATVVGGSFGRVQFTPDLVPADLVGTRMYTGAAGGFITELGPVFANLLLADEINRSSAKVQSALLEVMQERQVTIGKETFRVPDPFLVLATQNPIESDGTYPLPEAQLDRFMFKVLVDYPSYEDELVVVQRVTGPAIHLRQVLTPPRLVELQETVDAVYVDPRVVAYAATLVDATRKPAAHGLQQLTRAIQFGASPRASINLVAAARALAFMRGRRYALATDVEYLAPEVLRHRLVLTYESLAAGGTPDAAIQLLLSRHPAPRLDLGDRHAA